VWLFSFRKSCLAALEALLGLGLRGLGVYLIVVKRENIGMHREI
jgi:hypothetical protein